MYRVVGRPPGAVTKSLTYVENVRFQRPTNMNLPAISYGVPAHVMSLSRGNISTVYILLVLLLPVRPVHFYSITRLSADATARARLHVAIDILASRVSTRRNKGGAVHANKWRG